MEARSLSGLLQTTTVVTPGWPVPHRLIAVASPHHQPHDLIRIHGARIAAVYFALQPALELKFATDRPVIMKPMRIRYSEQD
jgi:hypothetical protein